MMSAHRTVPQFGPSRQSPFRFAAAALCTAFVLMAASGCTPMRKQGAVPTFPASTMNDAVEAYQKGDCRESIRRFSAALQQQEHPALLNGLGMAYLSCNQPRNAAQAFERAVSISPGSAPQLHAKRARRCTPTTITRAPNGNLTRPCGSIPPTRKPLWARRASSFNGRSRRRPSGSFRWSAARTRRLPRYSTTRRWPCIRWGSRTTRARISVPTPGNIPTMPKRRTPSAW